MLGVPLLFLLPFQHRILLINALLIVVKWRSHAGVAKW